MAWHMLWRTCLVSEESEGASHERRSRDWVSVHHWHRSWGVGGELEMVAFSDSSHGTGAGAGAGREGRSVNGTVVKLSGDCLCALLVKTRR
jgi:hypothetical protein